ncbi:MAG: MBL fold metallo-hydrolase [Acetobacteraceae bacterium]|nr:MBL fold metallo-hydrolase [Acetobacteraceae bacterium]
MEPMLQPLGRRVYLVPGAGRARFPYANGLYVRGDVRVLIDAGAGPEALGAVRREGVDVVINTHYHIDHVRGSHLLAPAPVWAHRLDAPAIQDRAAYLRLTGLERLGPAVYGPVLESLGFKEAPVCRQLSGGELLDFGGVSARVIHAPGHTPGHLALLFEGEGILFSADVDLTRFGPWYGNPASDIGAFLCSIDLLAGLRARVVVTGHSGPLPASAEAFRAYAARVEERDRRILEFLGRGRTLEELVQARLIYRRFPEPYCRLFERVMVEKHLARLARAGMVRLEGGRWRRAGAPSPRRRPPAGRDAGGG